MTAFYNRECPHFRPQGRIPSLPYGRYAMPLARKLRAGHVIYAVRHLYQRNVRFPALLRRDELDALEAEDITPALFSEWGRPIPDDRCVVVARKRG
jgi:hypothetical protein